MTKPGFFRYVWDEVITYRLVCFCSASLINGIFMTHFNYSTPECFAQAVCLGIILPGIFKDE